MTEQSLRDALEKLVNDRLFDDGSPTGILIKPEDVRDLLAAHPAHPAQPLLDRDAVRQAIADELDAEGVVVYGLTPKLTDVVMRALNGSGVDSSLHTCPGCGVKVIGHERCGDPTRPECAS